jgi:hypothetical protein
MERISDDVVRVGGDGWAVFDIGGTNFFDGAANDLGEAFSPEMRMG